MGQKKLAKRNVTSCVGKLVKYEGNLTPLRFLVRRIRFVRLDFSETVSVASHDPLPVVNTLREPTTPSTQIIFHQNLQKTLNLQMMSDLLFRHLDIAC